MKHKKAITVLVLITALVSIAAAAAGILTDYGSGAYEYDSIRGDTITIYGKGLYQHMSAETAIQGIAQDYVTLFLAVPVLLISLFFARKGSVKGRFLLAGTLGYFFVSYLFYLLLAMYNPMYTAYTVILGASFFALALTLMSFDLNSIAALFGKNTPVRLAGGFLMFIVITIALLWLGVVLPPLFDGSVYPKQLEHYTTLVVQGLDLAVIQPLAILAAVLFIKRRPMGYLLCPVYFVFLSFIMTSLLSKIIAMGLCGYSVIPVIFIIPVFCVIAIVNSFMLLK